MVRSHLEFANSVWSPYKNYLIEDLEKVQKRATKLVKGLSKMEYADRLRHLNLPTLKFRRVRGDIIEVYKIINGLYDKNCVPFYKSVQITEPVIIHQNCKSIDVNMT
jgi:hypothetical protein